jgi:hypothetical protein
MTMDHESSAAAATIGNKNLTAKGETQVSITTADNISYSSLLNKVVKAANGIDF